MVYFYSLPDWVNEAFEFKKTLEYLSAVWFEANTHSEEMKKLKAGYFLKEMLEHFEAKISSTLKTDLWIYSTHDVAIVNVLNGLNVYDVRFSLISYLIFHYFFHDLILSMINHAMTPYHRFSLPFPLHSIVHRTNSERLISIYIY